MLYVPRNDCACVVVSNASSMRCYDTQPRPNSTVNYSDYYYNSHYLEQRGQQSFSSYSTMPTCYDSDDLTTNVYYRNDLDGILVCFFIILLICFYFPYRLISRAFGRWLKW